MNIATLNGNKLITNKTKSSQNIGKISFSQFKLFTSILKKISAETKFLSSNKNIQHGNTTVLEHSLGVALFSIKVANYFNWQVDEESMITGALLHDYFLYDWHTKKLFRLHGYHHPRIALENAKRDYKINTIETDIIIHHMFPLTLCPPRTKEGLAICIADKICSLIETLAKHDKLSFCIFGKSFTLRKIRFCPAFAR